MRDARVGRGALLWTRVGTRWLPFAEFDLERDQRSRAEAVRTRGLLANTVMSSGYINNFLFRPER